MPRHTAVIDIGTNSTKLLVGYVKRDGTPVPAHTDIATTRIGRGVANGGRVTPEALGDTVAAIRRFVETARGYGCDDTFAFTTFGLRRAANARDVLAAIERRTGVRVRVLSGNEEARLAYASAARRLGRPRGAMMIVDVGGGSTEVVLARAGVVELVRSLPLGALHLTERFLRGDPIPRREYDALRREVRGRLARSLGGHLPDTPARLTLVASGGSATTAVWMARGAMRGAPDAALTSAQLRAIERACLDATLAQRRRLPGLPSERADIFPAGIAVIREVMAVARKRRLRVSGGGVREGALIHLAANDNEW